eukprot:07372.XXX_187366_187617_1 [CDS] Oithona nana genome sequencing.
MFHISTIVFIQLRIFHFFDSFFDLVTNGNCKATFCAVCCFDVFFATYFSLRRCHRFNFTLPKSHHLGRILVAFRLFKSGSWRR